ncbi:MAG: PPC domain-containing protein, partial [Acidobacteria bacterium]|nr:PPC domain-containing protein [Acidobacteriota bacterium]
MARAWKTAALGGLLAAAIALVWLSESPGAWRTPIRRGERRTLALQAEAGTTVRVSVEQWEINLTLAVVDPDGREVQGGDRGAFGREVLVFEAPSAGEYQLAVQAQKLGSERGAFRVLAVESRRTSPADRAALQGQEKFVRATELDKAGGTERLEKARVLYGDAAALYHSGELVWLEAQSKSAEGRLLELSGRRDKALERYLEALALWNWIGDEFGRMDVLLKIGRLSGHLQRKFPFVPSDEGFLEMWRKVGDRRGIAHMMSAVSAHYRREVKDQRTARRWAEQSIQMAQSLGDASLESRCTESLAGVYVASADYAKALQSLQRILMLNRSLGDERGQSAALGEIGRILTMTGQGAKAIPYLQRQVDLQMKQGDPTAAAEGMWQLTLAYVNLGDRKSADAVQRQEMESYVRRAMQYESFRDRAANLGLAYPFVVPTQRLVSAGRVEEALAHL